MSGANVRKAFVKAATQIYRKTQKTPSRRLRRPSPRRRAAVGKCRSLGFEANAHLPTLQY
jgi:hypothetical protein